MNCKNQTAEVMEIVVVVEGGVVQDVLGCPQARVVIVDFDAIESGDLLSEEDIAVAEKWGVQF